MERKRRKKQQHAFATSNLPSFASFRLIFVSIASDWNPFLVPFCCALFFLGSTVVRGRKASISCVFLSTYEYKRSSEHNILTHPRVHDPFLDHIVEDERREVERMHLALLAAILGFASIATLMGIAMCSVRVDPPGIVQDAINDRKKAPLNQAKFCNHEDNVLPF